MPAGATYEFGFPVQHIKNREYEAAKLPYGFWHRLLPLKATFALGLVVGRLSVWRRFELGSVDVVLGHSRDFDDANCGMSDGVSPLGTRHHRRSSDAYPHVHLAGTTSDRCCTDAFSAWLHLAEAIVVALTGFPHIWNVSQSTR